MNQAQHDFLNHALDGTPGAIPRDPWEDPNANAAFRVALEGGGAGVFKPETGESGTGGLYGPMWQNEIGAYRLDQALGFNLVPTTAPFQGADANGSSSIGSIQAWAPNSRLDPGGYDTIDQQKMGVLDYILGNGDRHLGNWLTQADGRPAAIDNGLTFPTSNAENLRSDFVRNVIGQQLDPSIRNALQNVNVDQLRQQLQDLNIPQEGIDGAVSRLEEVRSGTVTGQEWKKQGYLTSSDFKQIAAGNFSSTGWQDAPWRPAVEQAEANSAARRADYLARNPPTQGP